MSYKSVDLRHYSPVALRPIEMRVEQQVGYEVDVPVAMKPSRDSVQS